MDKGQNLPFWLWATSQNFLRFSQSLQAWSGYNVTGTSGLIAAPDGTATADVITNTTSASGGYIYLSVSSLGTPYVNSAGIMYYSVYLKAADNNTAFLKLALGGAAAYGVFDLANGVAIGTSYANSGLDPVSVSMLPTGNGWWRSQLVITVTSLTTIEAGIGIADPGSGTSIYAWGAQINDWRGMGPYQPTSDHGVLTAFDGVIVEPDFEYLPDEVQQRSDHRTQDGSKYDYLWGSYRKISVPVSWVDSAFKAQVNSWWTTRTELQWTDNTGLTVSSCKIVNTNKPIASYMPPYLDQWGGVIDLETY